MHGWARVETKRGLVNALYLESAATRQHARLEPGCKHEFRRSASLVRKLPTVNVVDARERMASCHCVERPAEIAADLNGPAATNADPPVSPVPTLKKMGYISYTRSCHTPNPTR